MTGIYLFSTTPGNNTNANLGVTYDEGWSPALVNNSLRQTWSDFRSQFNDLGWWQYGGGTGYVAWVYASSTSVTVSGVDLTVAVGNQAAPAQVGRRVKAVGSATGTIYGYISAATFSTNTTITFVWDSGSLSNETLTFYLSQNQVTGKPVSASSISTAQGATGTGNLTFATAPTFIGPIGVTAASGVSLTVNAASGTHPLQIQDSAAGTAINAGYLEMPEVGGAAKTTNYTAVLADSGKHIQMNGSSLTATIPANASVAYPIGTTLSWININASSLSIAITTDTLTLVNSTTTGTRTLARNGMATAIKIGTTSWLIAGAGLT